MKKIIIQFLSIFTILILLFKYNIRIKNNMSDAFFLFIKNVIPSMLPMLIITNYIKDNVKIRNKLTYFLTLSLSFAPSNAILTNNENELLYSLNINPLFSYITLTAFINKKKTLKIILINLIYNYLMLCRHIKKNNLHKISKNSSSINEIIKKSINNLLGIFGVVMFFNIITSIASVFLDSKLYFFLEIINGFNIIKKMKKGKLFLSIFLNSFSGIAIFFQMKSLNENIKNTLLSKKLLTSLIVSIVTMILI